MNQTKNQFKMLSRINIFLVTFSLFMSVSAIIDFITKYIKYGDPYEMSIIINGVVETRYVYSYQGLIFSLILTLFTVGCILNYAGWKKLELYEKHGDEKNEE